ATADELATYRLDVGDHEVDTAVRARLGVRDALPDGDRAGRARRRQLDDPELLVGRMVDVEVEAELLRVERLRAVHVRHGDDHELELQFSHSRLLVSEARSAEPPSGCRPGPRRTRRSPRGSPG